MKVLVCGGAGYIGSHMVRALLASGREVVVFDNLSTGHREALPDVELVVGDLCDADALARTFATHRIDAVLHFAARSLVGESVARPLDYYAQNVGGTLNLLQTMLRAEVGHIVFSSTAAVYGVPDSELIDESPATRPINPYGASKLMVERVLADAASAHGLRSVVFRYFNAAGADPSGQIGESHEPETHLIPNVLRSVLGTGPALQVFGDDYPTPDGTCVRDYVHVSDLAAAHLRAVICRTTTARRSSTWAAMTASRFARSSKQPNVSPDARSPTRCSHGEPVIRRGSWPPAHWPGRSWAGNRNTASWTRFSAPPGSGIARSAIDRHR